MERFFPLLWIGFWVNAVTGTILLIILIIILVGALPTWPYSSAWGYYPSGGLGLVVVILLILVLIGASALSGYFKAKRAK